MEMPKGFCDMVRADIKRLETADQLSTEEKYKLHKDLEGRYQACVQDWYVGLRKTKKDGKGMRYSKLREAPNIIQENLEMMKFKLETYSYGMNDSSQSDPPATNITVNTNVNISLSFEEARQKVEDMTALSWEQADEILSKIDELEKISKENISRKSKWEKVRPIISFALDKGADVAIAILSLVMQMKLGGTTI